MAEKDSILDNIELKKDGLVISVNPKFYPLSIIFSAAYAMLDKVHAVVDGDPNSEVFVELRPKEKEGVDDKKLKEIGHQFNDELINYSIYTIQATRTKRIRENLIESALFGNVRGGGIEQRQAPPPQMRNQPQNMRGPGPEQRQAPPPQMRNQPTKQANTQTSPRFPQPQRREQINDPLGIRQVKTPEEDQIPDPQGIMKDNTKRENRDC